MCHRERSLQPVRKPAEGETGTLAVWHCSGYAGSKCKRLYTRLTQGTCSMCQTALEKLFWSLAGEFVRPAKESPEEQPFTDSWSR